MTEKTTVTVPVWLYEQLRRDSELISHLTHYRGFRWIEAVREEMESDRKFHLGMFRKKGDE